MKNSIAAYLTIIAMMISAAGASLLAKDNQGGRLWELADSSSAVAADTGTKADDPSKERKEPVSVVGDKETKKEEAKPEPEINRDTLIIDAEKNEKERIEREKAAREKVEKERLERERTEKEKSKKLKLSIVDLSTKEYLALFVGYGGFFPVADYGAQYKAANMVSGTVGVYVLNFVGFSPELHVRYTVMDNKTDPLRYNSNISMVQFFPAIIYRYHIPLPRNTLTVYGRIWDGVSRVSYSSRNPFLPVFKETIVENINVFGLSAGCYYDVWKGLLIGLDVSYSVVFTAGKPLQGVSLMVSAGWRIL